MHLFLVGLLAVVALLWIIEGVRIYRGMSRLPRLEDADLPSDANYPTVSILFTARDEAAKLVQALPTLLAQDYPRYEVIAVNDRSRDATPRILKEFASKHSNLKVLDITELPPGWLGKPHALYLASQKATGEWLIFTDADVRFAPDLVRRAVALAQKHRWDHLTMLPLFDLEGFWEKTALTYWIVGLHLGFEPWQVSNPRSGRYLGVGAFQLLRRSAYEAIGTHRRLAMEVVDDIKLGKLVKQGGFRSAAMFSEDRLWLRYEHGLANIVRGFTKNLFAAMRFNVAIAAGGLFAGFTLSILPFIAVVFSSGITRALAAVAALAAAMLQAETARRARASPLYGFTHPLGSAIWSYVILRSTVLTLWRGGVVWRDTFYPLEELRKGLV